MAHAHVPARTPAHAQARNQPVTATARRRSLGRRLARFSGWLVASCGTFLLRFAIFRRVLFADRGAAPRPQADAQGTHHAPRHAAAQPARHGPRHAAGPGARAA